MKILVFVNCYIPGFKSGGPIRSIANLVSMLGDNYEFYIVTNDRDTDDKICYEGITPNQWNSVGKGKVYYLDPGDRNIFHITKLIIEIEPDIVYLNSFFHPIYTVLPLLARFFGMVKKYPTLIAPRGEFSDGALILKPLRKKIFLKISKFLGLHRDAFWHATSQEEAIDIKKIIKPQKHKIFEASNFSFLNERSAKPPFNRKKKTDSLKVCYLSRITEKKNLHFALQVLENIDFPLEFNIYGPISDKKYWEICLGIIQNLPQNIKVTHHGPIKHEHVCDMLMENDLMFLPTLGENFGHVIAESFIAGTPVLIADTTPWKELEIKGIGWDLPLTKPSAFANRIRTCFKMSPEEYDALRLRVLEYAANEFGTEKTRLDYQQMWDAISSQNAE